VGKKNGLSWKGGGAANLKMGGYPPEYERKGEDFHGKETIANGKEAILRACSEINEPDGKIDGGGGGHTGREEGNLTGSGMGGMCGNVE